MFFKLRALELRSRPAGQQANELEIASHFVHKIRRLLNKPRHHDSPRSHTLHSRCRTSKGGEMEGMLKVLAITLWPVLAVALFGFGQSDDVSGKWTATMQRGNQTGNFVMNLQVDGNKL